MTFKAIHAKALAFSGASILGTIGAGIKWFTSNVSVNGSTVCENVSPVLAGLVGSAIVVAGIVGTYLALVAPSTKPAANVAAVNATPGLKVVSS
jgi:hypothetical protein